MLVGRFIWLVCVVTGAVATCVVILSLWKKFQTNPTITGLDTDYNSWKVPFPAITLCPEKPANVENIRNILGVTDIFKSCTFKGQDYSCCDMFFPVFTENGFCHSFNSRHFFRKPENSQSNMHYIMETDFKWSLEFTVNSQEVPTAIYIVNSDEMVSYDIQPQHIWDFKVMRMSFSIKQTYTTEDTRQLSIKQKRCVFEDEIKLEVDHMYTYTACAIQCRMDNAMLYCGCVPFFYPNISSYSYCTVDELDCIAKHIEHIKSIERCDCHLGCLNTLYEVEAQNIKDEGLTDSMEAGFISWPMARYKREVLFGWVDLLVSFGGIAGLFLGFSILSGVEIFYYFVIRTFVAAFRERDVLDRYRKERENKTKPPHDLSLVPYFVSHPLPGRRLDEIVKRYKNKHRFGKKNNIIRPKKQTKKLEKWTVAQTIIPPFGIEFIN